MKQPTLAQRITYWREHAGLKQFQLAERCEVSPGSVSQWEAEPYEDEDGRLIDRKPSHENVEKIAKACGVALHVFWSDLPSSDKRRSA